MGGGLLRPGDQDGRDHPDLAIGGALGCVPGVPLHALRNQSKGSGGSESRIVIGRSVVAGLSLSPRPEHPFYGFVLITVATSVARLHQVAPTYLSVRVAIGKNAMATRRGVRPATLRGSA